MVQTPGSLDSLARPAEKTDADRMAILALLATTPNAPNVSETTVDKAIDSERDIVAIAKNGNAAARFVKAKDVDVIDIPWWIWDGADVKALHECLLEATRLALTRWPESATWVLGGVPMAGGKTPAEMRARSQVVADQWKVWFPSVQIRDHESNYAYAWSTVGKINADVQAVLSDA